jgi:repressor LexA
MAKKAVARPGPKQSPPEITDRQREIFDYVREIIVARGYAPTVREIGQHFGIKSPNGVTCHLQALEKKGLITREAFMSRAIQLTEAPQRVAALPFVGQLTAGQPFELLPEPHVHIEFGGLFASPRHCCLRVTGHSLSDDLIAEGDCLVIRRQSACNDGDLVLLLIDGTTAAVKRYYRETLRIRLESIHRGRPPAFADHVSILGLVVGVIRQF